MRTDLVWSTGRSRIRGSSGWILAAVLAAVFLVELDLFIVNVAVESMRVDLGAGVAELELVVAGYTSSFGVLLVVGGRLGDLYGQRRIFLLGTALFTVSSAACAAAPGLAALVGARMTQGAGAALMLPQAIAIIQLVFIGRGRALAFGLFGATAGTATIVAQLIGGLLVGWDLAGLGWRLVFAVNLPFGVATVIAATVVLPRRARRRRLSLDLVGAGLSALAVSTVILPLVLWGHVGAGQVVSLAVLVIPVGWAFLRWERRCVRIGRTPLAPPDLFRRPAFGAAAGLSFTFVAGNTGLFFLCALYLQGPVGMEPLHAGLTFTPLAACFGLASILASRWFPRIGERVLTVGYTANLAGTVILLCSTFAVGGPNHAWRLVPGLAIVGFGEGLGFTQLMNAVLRRIPDDEAGSASGVVQTAIQLGSAFGPALVGTVYALTGSITGALAVNLLLASLALPFPPLLGDRPGTGARHSCPTR